MNTQQPLAERMRPKHLDEYVGQTHLVAAGAVLRKAVESGRLPSMILWGPPGVGKTTLAHIISQQLDRQFYTLSAINSGVKDVREVIEKARKTQFFDTKNPILFIDEIHRFSKSQQDSLLGAVEHGTITLIGATTENPSFEVISPLLSRCQVYVLKSLEKKELQLLLHRAIQHDTLLQSMNIDIREDEALMRFSGGDARKLYNVLEIVIHAQSGNDSIVITNDIVVSSLQQLCMIKMANNITISYLHLLNLFAEAILMQQCIGWLVCLKVAKILRLLLVECSYWHQKILAWQIPMLCCWLKHVLKQLK